MSTYNDYLAHYGVLGMKWGVRKERPTLGHKTIRVKSAVGESTVRKFVSKAGYNSYVSTSKKKARKLVAKTANVRTAMLYKYSDSNPYAREYVDSVIKKGTKLQTITVNPDYKIPNRMYASYKPEDTIRYKGRYANLARKRYADGDGNDNVYKVININTKNINIPSHEKSASVFNDLYKSDKQFKKEVDAAFDRWNKTPNGHWANRKKLFAKVRSGKASDREMYDAFNITLTDHDYNAPKKFYKQLKNEGYGAIYDMNDSKYGGYKANAPVIIFDTKYVAKQKVDNMPKSELMANAVADGAITVGQTVVRTSTELPNKLSADLYKEYIDYRDR